MVPGLDGTVNEAPPRQRLQPQGRDGADGREWRPRLRRSRTGSDCAQWHCWGLLKRPSHFGRGVMVTDTYLSGGKKKLNETKTM